MALKTNDLAISLVLKRIVKIIEIRDIDCYVVDHLFNEPPEHVHPVWVTEPEVLIPITSLSRILYE